MSEQTCKFCGQTGLAWKETRGRYNRIKWRLFDFQTAELHHCSRTTRAESLNSPQRAESTTMENQHRKIHGDRELTQAEIDLMNEIKELGTQIEPVMKKIRAHIDRQYQEMKEAQVSGDPAQIEKADAEMARLLDADPYKWINWASDSIQSNLMLATRAVAQPTFF